jgi:outer membrane protein, multidrug efflux system
MKKALFVSFAGLLALSGCQVGPVFHQPDTQVPKTWAAMTPTAADTWPGSDWWTGFGSTQLDGLIQQAMAGNLDIAAAMARIEMANGQARQAGAALLPSIGAGVTGGATRQLSMLGHERHHIFDAGVLQASYELDFWGKNRSAAQAAENTADAAQFDAEVVRVSTAASVATTYINLLGLQDQLKILKTNLRREQDTLAGTTAMQQAGMIPLLAVAQQRQAVDSLAATIPPLVQKIEHLHTALAILVGVLPENLHLQPESLGQLTMPAVVAGLPSGLLLRRPDVQMAEAQLKAANANVRVAQADFFPSIDLTTAGGIESYTLSNFTVPPLGIYTLAASITQPLFHGGYLRGQLEHAKGAYQLALEDYRKTALSAFGDVEDALSATTQFSAQKQAEDENVASARMSYDMSREAFHAGTTTILSVLNGESGLLSAEQGQAQAQTTYLDALVGLYQALGGGWSSTSGTTTPLAQP